MLALNDTYEQLYGRFRENIRTISKGGAVCPDRPAQHAVEKVLDLVRQQIGFRRCSTLAFRHFEDLYQVLYKQERATTYSVYGKDDTLLASVVFLFHITGPIISWWAIIPTAKPMGASHILINAFIKDRAGAGRTARFGRNLESRVCFF